MGFKAWGLGCTPVIALVLMMAPMPLPAVLTRLVFSLPGPPCRVWEDRDECTEEEEEEEEEEVGGEGGPHLQREALTLPVWAPLRPMEMVTALSLV